MSRGTRIFPVGTTGARTRVAVVRACTSCGIHQSCAWRKGPNGMLCNKYVFDRLNYQILGNSSPLEMRIACY
jgi:hypothetical protein